MEELIDLSHALGLETPTAPDYPSPDISILETTHDVQPDGRRSLNSSRIAVGMHCGTHMDAPFHFMEGGRRIDQIPLERFWGPCVLADVRGIEPRAAIDPEDLVRYRDALQKYSKIVIHTGWYEKWGTPSYFTDMPVLSGPAADFLVAQNVHLVGIDTPSVDCPPFPAHLSLLGNDVVIVENLTQLAAIEAEIFELLVLPLKITDREASPARAIACRNPWRRAAASSPH